MANTLNEVPERIDRMLGNYRKVATGTLNKTNHMRDGQFFINLPINFQPRIVVLEIYFKGGSEDGWFNISSQLGKKFIWLDNNFSAYMNLTIGTKSCTLNITDASYYQDYTVKKWIAIE